MIGLFLVGTRTRRSSLQLETSFKSLTCSRGKCQEGMQIMNLVYIVRREWRSERKTLHQSLLTVKTEVVQNIVSEARVL